MLSSWCAFTCPWAEARAFRLILVIFLFRTSQGTIQIRCFRRQMILSLSGMLRAMINANILLSGTLTARIKQPQVVCHTCTLWSSQRGEVKLFLLYIGRNSVNICLPFSVYNAVALDDTAIIKEMIVHFRDFWNRPESINKVAEWLKIAVERHASAIRASLEFHAPEKIDEFDAVMKEVFASSEKFANDLHLQHCPADDKTFLLGFHPAPEASIGYLHMHVILMHPKFRQFSTEVHDWKMVPVQAVIEAIEEDAMTRRCDTCSTMPWWRRTLTSLGLLLWQEWYPGVRIFSSIFLSMTPFQLSIHNSLRFFPDTEQGLHHGVLTYN